MGYGLEVDMIRHGARAGHADRAVRLRPRSGAAMAEAGADVLVAAHGADDGGTIGAQTALTLDDCVPLIQAMHDAAKRVNPEILVLCHGGPIAEPDDAAVHPRAHRGDRRLLRRLVDGAAARGGCDDREHAPLQGDRREVVEHGRRFKTSAERPREKTPDGEIAPAAGPGDGLSGIAAIEATFDPGGRTPSTRTLARKRSSSSSRAASSSGSRREKQRTRSRRRRGDRGRRGARDVQRRRRSRPHPRGPLAVRRRIGLRRRRRQRRRAVGPRYANAPRARGASPNSTSTAPLACESRRIACGRSTWRKRSTTIATVP